MRQFVCEDRRVFRRIQVQQQGDLPAFRNAARGSNRRGIFEPDSERKCVGDELLTVVAGVAQNSSDRG